MILIIILTLANIKEISHGYLSTQIEKEENYEKKSDEEDENPDNKEYNDLKRDKFEKEKRIRKLENDYTEKIYELLILVQIHCQIKTDMYNKIKEAGLLNDF